MNPLTDLPDPLPAYVLRYVDDASLGKCRLVNKQWRSLIDSSLELWKFRCNDLGIVMEDAKGGLTISGLHSVYKVLSRGVRTSHQNQFAITRASWTIDAKSLYYFNNVLVFTANAAVTVIVNLDLSIVRFIRHIITENVYTLCWTPKYLFLQDCHTLVLAVSYYYGQEVKSSISTYQLKPPITSTSVYELSGSLPFNGHHIYAFDIHSHQQLLLLVMSDKQQKYGCVKMYSYPTGQYLFKILDYSVQGSLGTKSMYFESRAQFLMLSNGTSIVSLLIGRTLQVFRVGTGELMFQCPSTHVASKIVTSYAHYKDNLYYIDIEESDYEGEDIDMKKINLLTGKLSTSCCIRKSGRWKLKNMVSEAGGVGSVEVHVKAVGERFALIGIRSLSYEYEFHIYLMHVDHLSLTHLTNFHFTESMPHTLNSLIFVKPQILNGLNQRTASGVILITAHEPQQNVDFSLHPGEYVQRSELHFTYWPGLPKPNTAPHFDVFSVQSTV